MDKDSSEPIILRDERLDKVQRRIKENIYIGKAEADIYNNHN